MAQGGTALSDIPLRICLHDPDYINPPDFEHIHWLRKVRDPSLINCYPNWVMQEENIAPHAYGWITEPPEILPHLHDDLPRIEHQFKYIFTYHDESLNRNPEKYKLYLTAGHTCELRGIPQKSKLCSFVCSAKTMCPLHKFRHSVVRAFENEIDIYGYYSWIDIKNTGLEDYMFSIAIENSVQNDYFSEKIIDCFVTGTIPIYWGARNLGQYFDLDGVIPFDKFIEVGPAMLSQSLYESKKQAMLNNFEIAKRWLYPYKIFENMYYPLFKEWSKSI
jgi:hypothetical protein